MKNTLSSILCLVFMMIGTVSIVLADGADDSSEENKESLSNIADSTGQFSMSNLSVDQEHTLSLDPEDNNNNIFSRVIQLLARVFGFTAVLFYIIGAYFMISSHGDENQLQKGKTIFTYTSIGLAVAFLSYIAVNFTVSMLFRV